MEHNKVYFNLYYANIAQNQTIVNNVGLVVKNFNFRRILGNLYYKYNAFSIKLESYTCRTAATADPTLDFMLLHISGLNFINGYDSSPNYNYSRVLEVIDFSAGILTPFNFISACNTTMFYKPTSDTIDLTFFYTKINDELLVVNPDDVVYIFSITGIDAYKIHNPQRPIIKRPAELRTVNFSLQSYKAEIIDSRNRAYKFNINLRNIIGQDYDKYSKFCLITKYMNFSRNSGISFSGTFSGFAFFQLCLSGLDFITLSQAQYFTTTNIQQITSIHQSTPAIIASGAFGLSFPYQSYIENAFYKSSDVVDIVVSYNSIYGYDLVPANPVNTNLFPQFTINFDIIPIID
jgi:hypothetical protein